MSLACCRSRENSIEGRGHQISFVLANFEHRVRGGRRERSLSRSRHPADPANSEYRYHNGDVRSGGVCADSPLPAGYGDVYRRRDIRVL